VGITRLSEADNHDGRIEYCSQYPNTTAGFFPDYEFVRKLQNELETDQGSIFRYAIRENTYLDFIYQELKSDQNDIPDRDDLSRFYPLDY
jgi:hypothetical protein